MKKNASVKHVIQQNGREVWIRFYPSGKIRVEVRGENVRLDRLSRGTEKSPWTNVDLVKV